VLVTHPVTRCLSPWTVHGYITLSELHSSKVSKVPEAGTIAEAETLRLWLPNGPHSDLKYRSQ